MTGPFVGPILASILALAGTSSDVGKRAMLLLTYSAGLGVPFVLAGVLMGTGRLAIISGLILRYLPLNLG